MVACWRPPLRAAGALIAFLSIGEGELHAEEPAPRAGERVIVLVLSGALAPEEISPSERSPARALWSVALEGVALARVDLGGSPLVTASLESLRARLLPAAPAAERESIVLFESPPRDGSAAAPGGGEAAPESAETPRSIQNLHGLFRAPPPESDTERALRAAVLATVKEPGPAPAAAPPARPASELEAIAAAASARLAIFRARSEAGAEGIAARNELLGKLVGAAGADGHIVVACAPERQEGAVFARGPRLRAGWVIDASRPPGMVEAIVRRILGAEDARNEASEVFQ